MENKNSRSKTLQIVICALCAAIMAVCAQITVPLPSQVPITLQTFGIALCAAVFGAVPGTISTIVYVLLGIVGLPVFAAMKGGFETLVGPTGGFIYGFIPMALLCGLKMKNLPLRILVSTGGLAVCYLCGTVQFSLLMSTDLVSALMLCVLQYIVKDVISLDEAQYMAIPIRKAIAKLTNS